MKPNREKIEAEDLVKERLPLTKWELTPKEKEDFDRVMRLMFDAASILRYDLDGTVVLMSGSAASVVVASAYVLSSLFLGYVAVVCRQQVARRSFR
jgi:hypothetical protein